ncbi:MAG TPA: pirin family protein [Gammaproteobacteria bacterium]
MTEQFMVRQATAMKEGAGVDVKRLMPVMGFMNYDPFVLWDEFTISPGHGFPTHSHRGFEAITYMFEGTIRHEDNLGNRSTVEAGGAQRFTAGQGIAHSEMPSESGQTRGIQLWINLPRQLKSTAPGYQQVNAHQFPERSIDKGKVRILVGDESPLKLLTPVHYLEVFLEPDGHFQDILPVDYRGFIYAVEGQVKIGDSTLTSGEARFMEGIKQLTVSSTQASRFMVCFGKPHREPIRQHGPFVD